MKKIKFKKAAPHISMLWIFLLTIFTLSAQQQPTFTMKGTVYDENGETLPGATVYLKNKIGIGTATDMDGQFSIRAQRGDMIVFSFMGYEKIEYLVTEEKQDMEIRFTTTAQELEEVVVTSFGTTQRRISSVAAISTVSVSDLQQPVASVANLLGGRVAGVTSLQTSGEPGKNISEFWIRGIGTFGANASALVLIDGLEGDINSLDPADIESFSVLKDASATAVYGVRGANGVVLITTKRGTQDKLRITGRFSTTLSHLNRIPKYLRAYDYAKLANEAMAVRNANPIYSDIELDIIRDGLDLDMYPDVSWQDEVLNRNSWKQNYYVSAQGGAQVAKYFISLGGSNETAAYKYDKNSPYASNVGYNTYTYRVNLDLELSPSTNLYFGTDGFLSLKNNPGVADTDYIWAAQALINPTMLPTRYSNGQYPAAGGGIEMTSPSVQINHQGKRLDQQYKGKTTLALHQDFSSLLKGLKLRMQGSYDLTSEFIEQRFLRPALYQAVGRDTEGNLITIRRADEINIGYGRASDQFRKYHFESTLTYERVFADDHRVSGLVYYSITDQKKASDAISNLTGIPVRYQGVSSRLTYGFKDTYMIDLNFGYTGSENFQPGRQYGFFPSIALGWVLSGYDYVQNNMPWVNLFKIRGSYGTVGNDRLTGDRRFPYLTLVTDGYFSPWGSSSTYGVTELLVGADNLEWERSIKANLGLESRFLNERISLVADVFNDIRDGIFMPRRQVPGYAGLVSQPYGNVGKMTSWGADGNASYLHELSKDMSFTVRGNFTFYNNSVIEWEEAYPKYPYQGMGGYPNAAVRGYQSLGLFKDQHDIDTSPLQTFGEVMPGDIKYRDINGDGRIDTDDMVPLSFAFGRYNPPMLMYGFGGEFKYKQFTAGFLFKGTGKTDFYYVGNGAGIGYVPFFNGQFGNVLTIANDPANRWIPMDYAIANGIDPALAENPNARFPRLQYESNANNSQLSDFWKADARYLRLQEITLNYNFKKPALQKIGISSIDFQLVGSNLYLWDNVKLFDPEQAMYNGSKYPIPATYTLQIYIHM